MKTLIAVFFLKHLPTDLLGLYSLQVYFQTVTILYFALLFYSRYKGFIFPCINCNTGKFFSVQIQTQLMDQCQQECYSRFKIVYNS